MAEVGGMLAAAVLKAAAGKVAAAAGDRVAQQRRFRKDLEYMRDALESIEALLEDAEGQSIKDASVRVWLKRLTAASYSISDMFDEFEINTSRKSALRKLRVLNPCLTLASKVGMAAKMKDVREKLENISSQHHNFSFLAGSSSYAPQVNDERETSSKVIEANILGRDQEKQKVMTLLTKANASPEFIILPIYGIGGIGKTTLAQLLFNDASFKDYEKVWVYVSQTFDLKKIDESIRSQLQREQSQLIHKHDPDADPPARKKVLIVLDDLWENDDFKVDDLKHSLKMFCNGRKVHVIVTTRDAGIAHKIQTAEAYAIEPLSSDMCWMIIKQIVDFENRSDKESLEDTGKEIAIKCRGVALAARALGYMLRSRSSDGWISIKDSDLWNISTTGYTPSPYDNVLASLKLSYISMLPYLRLCFTYCAIFPKGHKMAKDDLIYQWTALEFITWQHGESCVEQLLRMSFFQHSKSPSSVGQHCEEITLFTMHDLVHDLARSIMWDEVFDASIANSRKSDIGGSNCRYVSLVDFSKPLSSVVNYPDKIRALNFLGSAKIGRHAAGFSTAKYLRVLDLGECSIQKLPSSIGKLKQLRYLNASGIKDRMIPSCITKLSKLVYLNVRESPGLALPESIGEMEGLMYLDLSGCLGIRELPESFRKLKNLVHLDFSRCSHVKGVSESLENLTQLRYLNLSGCMRLEELAMSLGKLSNLVHLDLSDCSELNGIPEALCSLTKLRHLNLSTNHVYNPPLRGLLDVIGKLTELRYLNLSSRVCKPQTVVPEGGEISDQVVSSLDSISTLSNLEHLELSNNRDIYAIPESFCKLRNLHTLDLTGCCNLQRLPENIGDMDSLKFLIVKDCGQLDMSTLQISRNLISLPNLVVHAAEGEQSSNLVLLQEATLPELKISRLENVKSVEEAQRIELREKQTMVKLALDWTRGKKGLVEDRVLLRELVPPSSLEKFELRGYNGVNLPTWIMDIAIYLPNLVRVKLTGLSQCNTLPPLGQLPNLKYLDLQTMPSITNIDRSFCGSGMEAFSQLYEFSISSMESLEEWSATYSYDDGVADEFMFPNLMYLTISGCPKLRVNPCPPRVKRTWRIEESDGVLQQWGESSPYNGPSTSSASVGCLKVKSCMAPIHEWKLLHHLPSLDKLVIEDCNDLSSSLEIAGVLCTLQELELYSCGNLTSLPQWLSDLTSLQRLNISGCANLNNLLESMHHLSSLQSLSLINCGVIQTLPDRLGDLVSLNELDIYQCHGIMCFPESIRQLTTIKRLTILDCPALKHWCKLEENKMKIGHIKKVDII